MKSLVSCVRIICLLLLLGGRLAVASVPQVPSSMEYCGITLNFTPKGREAIQKHVNKLRDNPLYFNILVEKSDLYMPFIEDALQLMHVPQDLKYICIQESGMQGDAVSSSNAVGFWQFKDFTAKEVGLLLDASVDERKHIFRSSVGAALYFSKNFVRHPNWVYSIISYYAGGTGAIPFINTDNYGVSEMTVDETLHWYAQKAIAHKVAFEEALGKKAPPLWLEPAATEGETSVWRLATRYGSTVDELRNYNKWITASPLPEAYSGSVYLPRKDKPYAFVQDPHAPSVKPYLEEGQKNQSAYFAMLAKQRAEPEPINRTAKDKAQKSPPEELASAAKSDASTLYLQKYRDLPATWTNIRTEFIGKDPGMGKDFVVTTENFGIAHIAGQFGYRENSLRRINDIGVTEVVPPGTIIWLDKPRKAAYYIVQNEPNLEAVGQLVRRRAARLAVLNHIETTDRLVPGQKIYLRSPRPAEEPIIVYKLKDDRIDLEKTP